jgi:hypothetical protein
MKSYPSKSASGLVVIAAAALSAPVGAQPHPPSGRRASRGGAPAARGPAAIAATQVTEALPASRRECSMYDGELNAHCRNVIDAVGGAVEGVARGTPQGVAFANTICDEVEAAVPTLVRALQFDTRSVTRTGASSGAFVSPAVVGPPVALRNAQAWCRALRHVPGHCTDGATLPAELEGALATIVTGTISQGSAYRLALASRPCPPPPAPPQARARAFGLAFSVGGATSMLADTRDRYAPTAVVAQVGPSLQIGRVHFSFRGVVEVSPFGVTYNGAPSSQVATFVGARVGAGYAVVSGGRAQLVTGLEVGGGYFTRTLARGDLPSNAPVSQTSGVVLSGAFVRLQTALSAHWSLLAEVTGGYRLFTSVDSGVGHDVVVGASMGGSYGF